MPNEIWLEVINQIADSNLANGAKWKAMKLEDIKHVVIHRISLAMKTPENPIPVSDMFLDGQALGIRFEDARFNTGGRVPYHFLIRPTGHICQLLPIGVRGTHAKGLNWCSIAIACVGDFRTKEMVELQYRSLVVLTALLAPLAKSTPKVIGHCEGPIPKPDCPGKFLDMRLLREDVGHIYSGADIPQDEIIELCKRAGVTF